MNAAGRVRRNVAEDVDVLALALGAQQSVVEPLELLAHLVAAVKAPSAAEEAKSNRKTEAKAVKSSHIKREAEIIVEDDGAQASAERERVVAALAERYQRRVRKPLRPSAGDVLVQPLRRNRRIAHRRGRKAAEKTNRSDNGRAGKKNARDARV